MADEVSVAYNADVSGYLASMDEMDAATTEMLSALTTSAQAAGDALDKGLGEGAAAAKEHATELEKELGHVGDALDEIHHQITEAFEAAGIIAAYEAVEKLGERLEAVFNTATEINNMSEVLGISIDQYQDLAEAAKETGVSMSIVSRTVLRLEEDFRKSNEGADDSRIKLLALGFSLSELDDKGMTGGAAMAELSNRLRDASTAQETMSGIVQAFGPRAALVAEVLKAYNGNLSDAERATQGVVKYTTEETEALHEQHKFWSEIGTDIATYTGKVVAAIAMSHSIDSGDMSQAASIAAVQELEDAKVKLKVGGAEEVVAKVVPIIQVVTKEEVENARLVVETTKAGTQARIDAEIEYSRLVTAQLGVNDAASKKAGVEVLKSVEERLDKETEATKKAAEAQWRFQVEYNKQIEEVGTKSIAVFQRNYEEQTKAAQAQADIRLRSAASSQVSQIDLDQKTLQSELSLHQISDAQYLSATIDLVNKRLAAVTAGLSAEQALYLGDETKYEELEAKKVAATAKANTDILAATTKSSKDLETQYMTAWKPIETSFESAMQNMATSNASFESRVAASLRTMVSGVFKAQIDSMVHSWVTAEATKEAASKTAAAVQMTTSQAAATQTKVVSGEAAKGEIQNSGFTAMAGAYKAMVGIPYVGPILAVAAMAAAEAAVMGLVGKIASAEGGMEVDHDQLAFVHKDEKILPAHISQGIDEKILGKGQWADEGKGGGDQNHLHVSAMDAKSFEKFITSQSGRNAVSRAGRLAAQRGNSNARYRS